MPKKYILFTDEELEGMKNGLEIEHPLESGEILYFMSKEQYDRKHRKPSIINWRYALSYLHIAQIYCRLHSKETAYQDRYILLFGMQTQYDNGDRSKELYDTIMKLTKNSSLFPPCIYETPRHIEN